MSTLNQSNIEAGGAQSYANSINLIDAISPHRYTNMDGNQNGAGSICIKFIIWIIFCILIFPLPFCDLYYAYNDDSCVNNDAGKLAINLKDYLLVYGWIMMSLLGFIGFALCFVNPNTSIDEADHCFFACGSLFVVLLALISIFSIIWNVFGAIIFWGLMDTNDCDSGIYNYVFASLIIKLIFSAFGAFQGNNNKNNK